MSRISQLGQCLVEKYGLSEQESEEFVTTLFSIIRESLLTDNMVKVKGLGTFKLAEMNARESVNVNTGERITIEGRYKLSFTPENAVRDRINSPFASFESMDMDNDMDFSDIDKKYESVELASPSESADIASPSESADIASPLGEGESHSPSQPEPAEEIITPVVDFVVDEPAKETAPAVEDVSTPAVEEKSAPIEEEEPTPIIEEEKTTVPVAEEPVAEKPVEVALPLESAAVESPLESAAVASPLGEGESHSPSESSPSEQEPKQEPAPSEPSPAPLVAAPEQEKPVVRAPICEELIQKNMNHNETIINLLHWLIGLVVLVLLCIGGYFIYNVGRDNGAMEYYIHQNDVEDADARAAEKAALHTPAATKQNAKEEAQPKHDISLVKTPGEQTPKPEEETKPETPAAKPATPAAKPTATVASPSGKGESHSQSQPKATTIKPAASSAVSDSYNNKDARVRTGAYNIVGTQETITVKAGQTLKSISKFYLGDGMECYVEVYNGGKTTFNAGDKVKIPKLELKKKKK